MELSVKQKRHKFNLECEQEADKMIRRGVAPWRALEEARKIVEKRMDRKQPGSDMTGPNRRDGLPPARMVKPGKSCPSGFGRHHEKKKSLTASREWSRRKRGAHAAD